jgi:putative effector of murein hydrolase
MAAVVGRKTQPTMLAVVAVVLELAQRVVVQQLQPAVMVALAIPLLQLIQTLRRQTLPHLQA